MWLRLPKLLELFHEFCDFSYNMLTLFPEAIPVFAETWTEYLGDLAHYRWPVSDRSLPHSGDWCRVVCTWYIQKIVNQAHNGQVYHALGRLLTRSSNLLYTLHLLRACFRLRRLEKPSQSFSNARSNGDKSALVRSRIWRQCSLRIMGCYSSATLETSWMLFFCICKMVPSIAISIVLGALSNFLGRLLLLRTVVPSSNMGISA